MGVSAPFILGLLGAAACIISAGPSCVFAVELNVPAEYSTIQGAIDFASPGDTIRVSPGNYVEAIDFKGKNLTLLSTDGPSATSIRLPSPQPYTPVVVIGPGGAFTGFTVTGGTATFGAGMAVNGEGSVIRGNVFDGNQQGSGGFGAAIGGNNSSPLIEKNVFRNNSADSQFLSGVVSFVNCSSPRIANNLFYNNQTRAINMTLPDCAAPVVINNTVSGNQGGIYIDGRVGPEPQTYRNNIIVGNGQGLHVEFGDSQLHVVWQNNLVYGNDVNYDQVADQTGTNGNISAAPFFVDQAANIFELAGPSPAIDTGAADGAPSDDIAGIERPIDGNGDGITAFDIGAYEFNGPPNPYDICLQDERTGDRLELNSVEGTYRVVRCNLGSTWVGTGNVSHRGGCRILLFATGDIDIVAKIDTCRSKGKAVIRGIASRRIRIFDSNLTDPCACR